MAANWWEWKLKPKKPPTPVTPYLQSRLLKRAGQVVDQLERRFPERCFANQQANFLASSTQSLPTAVSPSLTDQARIASAPWSRALVPSFSDCFFIALMAWLFVCGANGWKALLMDGDTGWHIRTGQYIIANHKVPAQDLFSFSKPGATWFAWEWLSDLWFAALYAMGGLKAIVLFAAALISTYATLLVRYAIWRGSNALLAALVTLLTVGSSTIHFLARPHLFTLILAPACLWLIEAD